MRDWALDAACQGEPISVFFASRGNSNYTRARAICAECPVLSDCRDDVMEYERYESASRRYGFRAGLKPEERYALDDQMRECACCGVRFHSPRFARTCGDVECVKWLHRLHNSRSAQVNA